MDKKAFEELGKAYREAMEEFRKEAEKFWSSLSYEEKLYAVAHVSRVLCEHAREGGTYRYLIYERFGFDFDSYAVLQWSGLLEIHNLISGELKSHSKKKGDDRGEGQGD